MRSVFLSLVIVVVFPAVAAAQVPTVAIYADPTGDQCNIVDSAGPLTFYVVVTEAAGLTAVQFAAPMPACFTGVTYVNDTPQFPVTIGNSQDGVAIAFGACLQTPIHVLTIHYSSNGAVGPCCIYPVVGDPNIPSGEIELTDCDINILYGQTGPSTINGDASCPCSDKPYTPSNPSPTDGAVDVPLAVTLSWDAGDPQGDPLTFDVYFGSSVPPPLVATDQSEQSYDAGTLDPETQYYWQIVARDPGNREARGPVWTFTTLRVRPDPPSNPSPENSAKGVPVNVTLSWDASDPQGDPMTFDVYFGTSVPPPLVATDHPQQSYDVGPLATETDYRWMIVARDSGGNETSSSMWVFTTVSERPDPPSNPTPENTATDVPLDVVLTWDASDPQGDPMTFDVYFGESATPPLLATDHPQQSYAVGPLTPETDHYWRIVARDPDGDETSGPTWVFTTLRERPDPPSNPSPPDHAVDVPLFVTLSWEASDPQGDQMTFDVYFGTSVSPPLVATDHPQQSYDVGPLTSVTDYFWKVVARDPDGDETSGNLWRFTTLDIGDARLEVTSFFNYCGLITTDTVTVEVLIVNNPAPIDAGGVDITYDSSVLTLLSCEPGALTSGWQEFGYSDQDTIIRVGGYDLDPIPTGSYGTFAVLTFLSDCCGAQDPVSVVMCPVNLTDGLINLAPVCGEFRCDMFSPDGDVNANGRVTPGDALCAFRGYLSFPDAPEGECGTLGWDVRSDVDCSNDLTPADAACIFDHWLDGSCQFCSPAPPAGPAAAPGVPPVVSVGDVEINGGVVALTIQVSDVRGMRSFGFEMTYPRGLEYAGIDRTGVTGAFIAVDAHVLADGHLRAGGYSGGPVEDYDAGDIVVLRFRIAAGEANGTLIVQEFVDHLRGAEVVTYQLGSDQTGQPVAASFRLYQNYPNPFNPVTTIGYEIPENVSNVPVKLTVYDVNGKRIRELVNGTRPGGLHHVTWDARNDRGVPVSSGLYFYVLRAGSQTLRNKMVLLR